MYELFFKFGNTNTGGRIIGMFKNEALAVFFIKSFNSPGIVILHLLVEKHS